MAKKKSDKEKLPTLSEALKTASEHGGFAENILKQITEAEEEAAKTLSDVIASVNATNEEERKRAAKKDIAHKTEVNEKKVVDNKIVNELSEIKDSIKDLDKEISDQLKGKLQDVFGGVESILSRQLPELSGFVGGIRGAITTFKEFAEWQSGVKQLKREKEEKEHRVRELMGLDKIDKDIRDEANERTREYRQRKLETQENTEEAEYDNKKGITEKLSGLLGKKKEKGEGFVSKAFEFAAGEAIEHFGERLLKSKAAGKFKGLVKKLFGKKNVIAGELIQDAKGNWRYPKGAVNDAGEKIGGRFASQTATKAATAAGGSGASSLAGKFGGNMLGAGGAVAALGAGLLWAAVDGIGGAIRAKRWGVSKTSGVIGGVLGGTTKGLVGAFTGMGKWALIGAGIGSFVPVVGTVIGGVVGGALGAIMGWIGGEKIAKGLDGLVDKLKGFFVDRLFGKDSKVLDWAKKGLMFGPLGAVVGGALGVIVETIAAMFDFNNAAEMLKPVKLAIEDALWKFFQGVIDMFHLDKFGIKNPLGDNKPSEETAYQEMYGEGTFKAGTKATQAGKSQRENYQKVKGAIGAAAQSSGVSESTLTKFAMVESGFDAGIGAKTSSAKGLFQFTKGTWHYMINRPEYKKYGFTDAMITDPKANAIMGAAYINDNKKALAKGGWAADDTNLYLAHFLGSGGVTTFLNAWKKNPNAIAANILPKAAAANPNVFYDKKTKRPKTVQEVGQWAANKMNINLASLGPGAPIEPVKTGGERAPGISGKPMVATATLPSSTTAGKPEYTASTSITPNVAPSTSSATNVAPPSQVQNVNIQSDQTKKQAMAQGGNNIIVNQQTAAAGARPGNAMNTGNIGDVLSIMSSLDPDSLAMFA